MVAGRQEALSRRRCPRVPRRGGHESHATVRRRKMLHSRSVAAWEEVAALEKKARRMKMAKLEEEAGHMKVIEQEEKTSR